MNRTVEAPTQTIIDKLSVALSLASSLQPSTERDTVQSAIREALEALTFIQSAEQQVVEVPPADIAAA